MECTNWIKIWLLKDISTLKVAILLTSKVKKLKMKITHKNAVKYPKKLLMKLKTKMEEIQTSFTDCKRQVNSIAQSLKTSQRVKIKFRGLRQKVKIGLLIIQELEENLLK